MLNEEVLAVSVQVAYHAVRNENERYDCEANLGSKEVRKILSVWLYNLTW